MVTVPGKTVSVPPPEPEADPPQPARRMKTGTVAPARILAGDRRRRLGLCLCLCGSTRRLEGREGCLCGSTVTAVPWLNLPGAFLAALPADFSLDAPILFPVSAGAYGTPQRQLFPHDL